MVSLAVRKGQMAAPVLLTNVGRLVQGAYRLEHGMGLVATTLPPVHLRTTFHDLRLTEGSNDNLWD